jgi:hypothetical protein
LITRHDVRTLVARPWKNGGGVTREIALAPREAGLVDFDWRASIATIDASGPFSAFPDIVLLDGDGVELVAAAFRHRLHEPLVPFRFDGAAAVNATLLGGASTDFNVMTRAGRCRAVVRVVRGSATLAATRAGVVHAVAGRWAFDGRHYVGAPCGAGQGFAWDDDDGPRTAALVDADSRDAALIAVAIERAAA